MFVWQRKHSSDNDTTGRSNNGKKRENNTKHKIFHFRKKNELTESENRNHSEQNNSLSNVVLVIPHKYEKEIGQSSKPKECRNIKIKILNISQKINLNNCYRLLMMMMRPLEKLQTMKTASKKKRKNTI